MNTHNKNSNEKEPLIIHLSDDDGLPPSNAEIENQLGSNLWRKFNQICKPLLDC